MSTIRKLRKHAGLTQAQFANILNVSRTTVTMWECDNRLPDYDVLKKIAAYFSVSTDFIVGSGVFENWEEILENKELIFSALRNAIPNGYIATGDDKMLIAKLDGLFFYNFDEIALARWFAYAVKSVKFTESYLPKIQFTPEFSAVTEDYRKSHNDPIIEAYTLDDLHQDFINNQKHGKWIPVLGDVAAGIPIEATENIIDYEEISAKMAATGDFFALRIKGNSMEPKISDGDVVIVRQQNDVDTGDTAIVLVNGDSATCKRVKKELDGSLWLLPTNPAYDARHFSPTEIRDTPVAIIGKVVELRAKF